LSDSSVCQLRLCTSRHRDPRPSIIAGISNAPQRRSNTHRALQASGVRHDVPRGQGRAGSADREKGGSSSRRLNLDILSSCDYICYNIPGIGQSQPWPSATVSSPVDTTSLQLGRRYVASPATWVTLLSKEPTRLDPSAKQAKWVRRYTRRTRPHENVDGRTVTYPSPAGPSKTYRSSGKLSSILAWTLGLARERARFPGTANRGAPPEVAVLGSSKGAFSVIVP